MIFLGVGNKSTIYIDDFVGGESVRAGIFGEMAVVLFLLMQKETYHYVLGSFYIQPPNQTINSGTIASLVNPDNIDIAVRSHTWAQLEFVHLSSDYNYHIVLWG